MFLPNLSLSVSSLLISYFRYFFLFPLRSSHFSHLLALLSFCESSPSHILLWSPYTISRYPSPFSLSFFFLTVDYGGTKPYFVAWIKCCHGLFFLFFFKNFNQDHFPSFHPLLICSCSLSSLPLHCLSFSLCVPWSFPSTSVFFSPVLSTPLLLPSIAHLSPLWGFDISPIFI